MGFWLKKLVGAWLSPLPAGLLLVGLGALLWWRGWAPKRGPQLAIGGVCVLYLASLPLVSFLLIAPLEADQSGYVPTGELDAIAVLGAGYRPVAGRPLTSVLSGGAVVRVAEAVRIWRLHPGAELHCSGWGGKWPGSSARAACDLAVSLGVSATRTRMHADARDTEEEAVHVAAATRGKRLALVTHAGHMKRAVAMFRHYGADVVPAPTGHVSPASPSWSLMPSARAMGTSSGAIHEWLGRAWFQIRAALGLSAGTG